MENGHKKIYFGENDKKSKKIIRRDIIWTIKGDRPYGLWQ